MKNLIILAVLFISSCASNHASKTQNETNENNSTMTLHDIWAIEKINGKAIDYKSLNQRPTIELHIKDKKVMGNDGCNRLGGGIAKVDEKNLSFSDLFSTKMACPNMQISDSFTNALELVRTYKIKDLKLYCYDDSGNEVLVFQKVD